jgi:hypothetical protein
VLTLIPDSGAIRLISTSRHITQGPVELKKLNQSASGNSFTGISHLIRDDPYKLSFVFPAGTNYMVTRAVARAGLHRVPVTVLNHQGWAAVKITSPKTQDVDWEIEFRPATNFLFPPSAPERLFVRPIGLDGASLNWREQYYLNAGYEVFLDNKLLGQTPEARFLIRNLDPTVPHVARVKTVGETGTESPRAAQVNFNLSVLVPRELLLTQLQPEQSTGRWNGYEIEELLAPAPLSVAGQHYSHGLAAFAGSEVDFNLYGLFDTFTANVGIDDDSRDNSTAEFSVLADGKEVWRGSGLKKSDAPTGVKIPIKNVKKLTLRTRKPDVEGPRGQADWIEPKVSKAAN